MMANQIAAFFAAQGEERAVPQIADHINKFWDPRMRKEISAHVEPAVPASRRLPLEPRSRRCDTPHFGLTRDHCHRQFLSDPFARAVPH